MLAGIRTVLTIVNVSNLIFQTPFIKKEFLKLGLKPACNNVMQQLNVDPKKIKINFIDEEDHKHRSCNPFPCRSSGKERELYFDPQQLLPESPQGWAKKVQGKSYTINQEGRFILGHELIHIRDQHYLKRWIAFFAIPLFIIEGLPYYNRFCNFIERKIKYFFNLSSKDRFAQTIKTVNETQQKVLNSLAGHASMIILLYLSFNRHLEKQADIQAAQSLNCVDGALHHYRCKKLDETFWLFSHYPSLDQRFAYLEALKK